MASSGLSSTTSASSSSVKVAVRVRPLLSRESAQQCIVSDYDNTSIEFKGQQFTFDHVFGMELSQTELYSQTAAPMLKGFLEGYNVTIIAYGQTGSGKTYTMGTSDAVDGSDCQGLIPRFMTDLFENISSGIEGERLETKVNVSFIEIYGEDVYDLLNRNKAAMDRSSLSVREDDTGRVFVQGVVEETVESAAKALDVLSAGSRNRITASTQMNAGSSRSHAVFTVSLQQTIQSTQSPDDVQQLFSKLTFVDLAGSERIKRTGAEGQRLKEGIQINSGLFNLGQVINALADDQRLKQGGKPTFVPYRNSKLTHLLRDALGGNSQTLFLACISPAESNESESYSTLSYARQARNIQNKPVRNMDKMQLELRRLKFAARTWMTKAIVAMFSAGSQSNNDLPVLPQTPQSPRAGNTYPSDEEALLRRPDVQQFIDSVNATINSKLDGLAPSPRKVRLSLASPNLKRLGANISKSAKKIVDLQAHHLLPVNGSAGSVDEADLAPTELFSGHDDDRIIHGVHGLSRERESVVHLDKALDGQDLEESERMIARMMEMLNEEKELALQSGEQEGELEIVRVDKAIEEKEEILNKLMDSVKGYAAMKSEFEKLLEAIGSLETERAELEQELERAKRATANGGASNEQAVERMKERFLKVKEELKKMKDERTNKENAYRVMQRESKKVGDMQRELNKLKESKVLLIKQQKQQSQQLQKIKKEQNVKLTTLKKSDLKRQRLMNNLKSEIVKKDRVLGHKDREISRITSKLKACEDHITQLLKIQTRNRSKIPGTNTSATNGNSSQHPAKGQLSQPDYEHLLTSKAMLDNLIVDRLERKRMQIAFEKKSACLTELNKELLIEAAEMETLAKRRLELKQELKALMANTDRAPIKTGQLSGDDDDDDDWFLDDEIYETAPMSQTEIELRAEYKDVVDSIHHGEANIDRISRELDLFNADLDMLATKLDRAAKESRESGETWELLGKEIMSGLTAPQAQAIAWDYLGEKSAAMDKIHQHEDSLEAYQEQIENLTERVADLEKELAATENSMQDKLLAAEKQRSQDVWALLRASVCPGQDSLAESPDNAASTTAAASTLQVAVTRAQDLERELDACLQNEEVLKQKVSELQQQVTSMEITSRKKQLSALFAVDSGSVGRQSTDGSVDSTEYFSQLTDLWDEIGIAPNERALFVSDLLADSKSVLEEAVQSQKIRRDSLVEAIASSEANLNLLCEVLGPNDTQVVESAQQMIHRESIDAAAVVASMTMTNRTNELISCDNHLLVRLQNVETACRLAGITMAKRAHVLSTLKEKLLDLISEMWLSMNDLTPSVQILMRVTISRSWPKDISTLSDEEMDELLVLADQFHNLNAHLFEEDIEKWSEALKKMNVNRAKITSKILVSRQSAAILCSELSLTEKDKLQAVFDGYLLSCNEALPSMQDLGISDSSMESPSPSAAKVSSKAASIAVTTTLSQCSESSLYSASSSNPPGSAQLLAATEKLNFLLESIKTNRAMVWSHVQSIAVEMKVVLRDSVGEHQMESTTSQKLLGCSHELEESLEFVGNARINSISALAQTCARLDKLIEEIRGVTNPMSRERMIESILRNHYRRDASDQPTALDTINENISSLDELSVFLEEQWIAKAINRIVDEWSKPSIMTVNDYSVAALTTNDSESDRFSAAVIELWPDASGQSLMRLLMLLQNEAGSLTAVSDTTRELHRVDAQLRKHISDMEEFEAQSKLNRSKLLSGNSKALVEEEKFRKNGKKKYESLSEKLLHLSTSLQSQAHCVSGIIPVESQAVFQTLSSQAQSIIRSAGSSKVQERVELMHLHTLTHGTRRWSGGGGTMEKETLDRGDEVDTAESESTIADTSSIHLQNLPPTNSMPMATLHSQVPVLQKPSRVPTSTSGKPTAATPGTASKSSALKSALPVSSSMTGASRVPASGQLVASKTIRSGNP